MDSLNISTGAKHIAITRDGEQVGELVFNADDVVFAEKFYRLYAELGQQFTQYQSRAQELDTDKAKDANDLPVNLGARIELAKEACAFAYEQIDILFGAGTSAMVFGDTYLVSAIEQFLQGVAPYIQTARVEKIQKYTNKRPRRNGKK
jgi:hypothetical protein